MMDYFKYIVIPIGVLLSTGCATSTPNPNKTLAFKHDYTRSERGRMLVEIANAKLVEGDSTGALQHLARAEREDSNLPELYHSKALAYSMKHDLESALVAARKAVDLKGDYAEANNTLGKLLMDAGKFDEAIGPLKIAAQDALYRDAYKAWTTLGMISYKRGNYDEAAEYLDRAIREAPVQACVAYYYRGHLGLRQKRLSDAIANYSLATKKVCALFSEAQLALGMAYFQDRQFEAARKTFLEIQKRYPNTKFAKQALDQLKYIP